MVMLLMLLDPANPQRPDPFDVFSTAPHTFSPFSIGVPDNAFAVLHIFLELTVVFVPIFGQLHALSLFNTVLPVSIVHAVE